MKKSKIFKTLAVAGACLCAPLVLSGCVKENSSKVDFRVKDGYIQVTEDGKNWKNLIDIDDLKGEQGLPGEPGLPGENGVGVDGKEVEFQVADGWIQWKYTIDTEWTNLIELEELKGEDGEDADAPTIYIGGNGNWIINGEDTGVKAEAVNGETGNGIQNVTIDPNKSDASKTTYVITFTNGTTFEFEVYNGEDGEDAVAPTITIGENGNWFIDGVDSGVKAEAVNGETGNGIQNITINPNKSNASKTTYVITFTDGTTFEFEVYNGQDGKNAEAEEYTITYDYGAASEFFQTAPTSETIKSIQWLTTLPSIKSDYIECFKGWFIKGTEKQIENYDFIGGDVTLEARFYINESSPAGLYKNGKVTETWQQLIDSEYITVDGTTITDSSNYYIRGELVINNSIDTIGREAFESCTGLTSIEIPNSVTTIGHDAFYGCKGLTSIEIPSSVTSIGSAVLYGCAGLTSITVNSGNTIYRSEGNCLIRKSDNTLIAGCKTSVIPSSVTSIGDCAFYGCTGLTSIEIPNSVTLIGEWAFEGCAGLTEIEIPSSVTLIGDYVFRGCTGLTSITVNSGNTIYRSEGNCLIRKSDNTLIAGCKTSVIPNSVTSIMYEAFRNCTGLTLIEIPSSVTTIGHGAFSGCTGLASIEISNSVTTIVNQAFLNCTGLTEIVIPSSVTSIGDDTFIGCTGLTSITVDSGNSVYRSEGNCIIRNSDNTLILGCKTSVIPSGVTTIGSYAFYGCTGLTEITIPSSVTTIGAYAFPRCTGLKTVVIDSATIANNLTDVAYYNNGALLSNATTIYIKSGLDVSGSTYLASHFTKQSTSDRANYDKYVLNEN